MPAPVRLGVAGFGVAGRVLLPFVDQHPDVVVTAVADPREQARAEALSLVGGSAVATVEELCQRDDVDAVYVATPTQLHAEHAVLAASSGKAVVVEKPMATSIAEALAIVEAADSAGVTLVVGHSQSFEAPVRAMRDLVAGGSLGRLRAINAWYFTDWMYRPRHPDELDPDQGGGVTMRQAAHHVDIVRHLGGGLLRSVRAMTGVWDPSRRSDGSYSAYLEFEDSTPATVFYSGYDHFPSAELTFGLGEAGQPLGEDYAVARRRLREVHSPEGELALKTGASSGGSRQLELLRTGDAQPFFGLVVVSCEGGDVRVSPDGLLVYDDQARRAVSLADQRLGREVLLDELVAAVRSGRPAQHDGCWGLANLEVCVAIRDSALRRQEVDLHYQVALRPAS
jgi:phthalate 4,5-cis-dihydrodiol dehydrogenase